MKRLTEKIDNEYIVSVSMGIGGYTDAAEEKQYEANQKLGELEDIEEELGIDLKTFKAIHNIHTPIYYKRHANRKTISCNFPRKVFSTRKGVWYLCVDTYDYYLRFKNYGKTWALTKEELL